MGITHKNYKLMKTLKEIHAEANRYAPDNEALRDAFVNGARFMATGKYYKEKPMSPKENEVDPYCKPFLLMWRTRLFQVPYQMVPENNIECTLSLI